MGVRDNGLGLYDIPMNARHDRICVDGKFGLAGGQSALQQLSRESDGTYIEDVKDPVELQLPARDRLFVGLRVEMSRDRTSFLPIDDVPVDLGHSPAIESSMSESPGFQPLVYNSRFQLLNRRHHRLTQFVLSAARPPEEGLTDISAGHRKLNILYLIHHRVLCTSASNQQTSTGGKPTLIIVRRTPAKPNTALAGVSPITSFAIFMVSIAAFSEESMPSRRLVCWDVVASDIVVT